VNKWAIALLVGINGLLFAHLNQWVDLGLEAARDPTRQSAQVNQGAFVLAKAPGALTATGSSAVAVSGACLQFPPLGTDEAAALQKELTVLVSPLPIRQEKRDQFTNYLVYLPAADSLRAAQRKVLDLNKLGIDDTFVIPEGPLKWSISLGLFKSREGAQKLISALNQLGIGDVRVDPRTSINLTVLAVDGLSLEQIRAVELLSSKGQDWVAAPCKDASTQAPR
jgi:SPOR domain